MRNKQFPNADNSLRRKTHKKQADLPPIAVFLRQVWFKKAKDITDDYSGVERLPACW